MQSIGNFMYPYIYDTSRVSISTDGTQYVFFTYVSKFAICPSIKLNASKVLSFSYAEKIVLADIRIPTK